MLALLPDLEKRDPEIADDDVPVLPATSLRRGRSFVLSQYPLPHIGAVDQLGVHKDSRTPPAILPEAASVDSAVPR